MYECMEQKRGGILADDMGLGKTIQGVASYMGKRNEEKDHGRLRRGRGGANCTCSDCPDRIIDGNAPRVLPDHGSSRGGGHCGRIGGSPGAASAAAAIPSPPPWW